LIYDCINNLIMDKKVYLPAIAGHVPSEMVRAVQDLIKFSYLVRRSVIDEDTLSQLDKTLQNFHTHREIFRDLDVRPEGFSLPRQHSLAHYRTLIQMFGAPNGLCSSITESKHIKVVKRTYRRSSRNKPLGQMLVSNQRLDKLAAARVDFTSRGMLDGPGFPAHLLGDPPDAAHSEPHSMPIVQDEEHDVSAIDGPRSLSEVTLAKTPGM
jgi:hypothetical protein